MLCVETTTCVLLCHCYCAITEILCATNWGKVAQCWDIEPALFLFFVLRMKSSLLERSWAPHSSSTGPLPDDDSKHGWVVFESWLLYSTYIKKLARRQGNTWSRTPLTHPLAGTARRKITHVRERKSVRRLLTAPDGLFYTHLCWSFYTVVGYKK